jgi:hypothetical protein
VDFKFEPCGDRLYVSQMMAPPSGS